MLYSLLDNVTLPNKGYSSITVPNLNLCRKEMFVCEITQLAEISMKLLQSNELLISCSLISRSED
jgi:hypothetical protein